MLDKIEIVSLDTIDVANMTPVYERSKYYGPFDYSRWVFRDESTRYYYKIWNETYVKSNNIISGLISGLYDETTVPALKGLIFYNGYCRGYIMDDLGDVANNIQFEKDILKLKYKPLLKEDFLDMEMHQGRGGKEIILNGYTLKTVRDVVNYFSNTENLNKTIETLQPTNWQYFNCMLAEFRHNVGDHHVLGWENMTKEYYESLDEMSDAEIANFLEKNPVPFEAGFIKHGFHRACSMIGRLIKGKPYIPFHMDLKKYGGHIKNPVENINFIRILDDFGIPRNEYSISNSAILSLMGIESRVKNNGDLDIVISSKVRKFLDKTKMRLPSVAHPFGKNSGKFRKFGCKDDDDLVYNYSVNILGFNFTEPRFYFNRMHRVMNSQHRSFEENKKIKQLGKEGVENFQIKESYKRYPFNKIEYNKWGFDLVKELEIVN